MPQRKKDRLRRAVPRHLVDTNVLLRYLIGDDPSKAIRATDLMERVERSEERIEITVEVLTEVVWTLASFYKVPRSEIAENFQLFCIYPE